MTTTAVRKLYAYAHGRFDDPHAVIIEFEQFPALTNGWKPFTDAHGNEWEIRKADCGAGCKCAAEARVISHGKAERVETSDKAMPRVAFTPSMAIVILDEDNDLNTYSEPADALDFLHKRIDEDGPKDNDTTAEAKRRAVWVVAACGEDSHQMKILWTARGAYRVFKVEPDSD